MSKFSRFSILRAVTLSAAALALAACGSDVEIQQNQVTNPPVLGAYSGPAPATEDTQAFMLNVWSNLRLDTRCGGCHGASGTLPLFARSDDVNLAYQAVSGLANLTSPGDSRLVSMVAGGHNCWLSSNQACADLMIRWIGDWAGGGDTQGRQIELVPPALRTVQDSRTMPADPGAFQSTVYPLLRDFCAGCHSGTVPNAVAPFFADSDVITAYAAARARMNLDSPELSRFVARVGNEFHNCWSGDCTADGIAMRNAIAAMADLVPVTQVDPSLVTSMALGLLDGIVAAGGNRSESSQIAFWEFKEGQGNRAFDTSGVEPAINLTLSGDVEWFGGWGIDLRGGKAQGSVASSRKLHDLIRATGEYSIEAWIVPGNVTQEEVPIVTYSAGAMARNFTLGQTQYNYDFLNRSEATSANGMPGLSTPAADEVLQATLQHVVVTWDPVGGRQIFVNATPIVTSDPSGGGLINDWDNSFALVLGNEPSSDRPWEGVLRQVAIHNRVLTPEQIAQNLEAGVGEKFFLLFHISEHVGIHDSYILLEVSQFDSHAYLFAEPRYVNLGSDAGSNIRLQGMRIGINGAVGTVGQAFSKLDTTLGGSGYDPATGQLLSRQAAVIGLQSGPEIDEFFLSFERLGSSVNIIVEPTPQPPSVADGTPSSAIGVRTFDRINATMSVVTGIPITSPDVRETFTLVRQQLPSIDNIETFVSAQQIGVTQLAIEYCNTLLEDTAARSSYFPGFNFGASPSVALSGGGRDLLINPLMDRMFGVALQSQPAATDVRNELNSLIDRLSSCGGSCPAGRTVVIGKASCAAVLGSAPMLVH
jgi:hypothetical protein